jgi:hypothetical protein
MKFTIATLTAVMLSLTTVDVNAVKIHTTMKQKKAIAKHSIPDDVALFMVDDIEQPEIDEEDIEDFLKAIEDDAEIDWDYYEEVYYGEEDLEEVEAEVKSEDKAEAKSEDKAEAKPESEAMPEVDTQVLVTWDTLVCNAGEYEMAGSCYECPPGFMSFHDSQSCTLCPDNYYSVGGSSECTICPDGYSSISPAGSCDSMETASQLA